MDTDNFHARLSELYSPPKDQFTLVEVPEIRYAAIDGRGDPQGDECAEAVQWLFALVHVIKPIVQARMGKNFIYPPLEFLHWAETEQDFVAGNKDKWRWRAMIVFVDWITDAAFADAVAEVAKKRGAAPQTLRLENIKEGKSVQTLYIGDYDGIGPVCEKMYGEFLPANKLRPNGYYHEIYLNDPERVAADKRRTLIRQPVVSV